MIVTCVFCHLDCEEIPLTGAVVVMRRPHDTLLPVEILNVHVFECPRCARRVTISFDIDRVSRSPGHEVHDVLQYFKRNLTFHLFFNYQNAIDQSEGEELGFLDREGQGKYLKPLDLT